jgi:hypothetical protein
MRKIIILPKLLEMYKDGQRDFSNIMCSGVDFSNLKMPGCNFTNSDLSYSRFDGTDLSGCNFTKANLEWSSFRMTNLSKADLTKANLSYSVANRVNMDSAILNGADISWCIIFDANMNNAKKENTNFFNTAFNPSEISEEVRTKIAEKLVSMKGVLDFETYLRMEMSFKTEAETIGKAMIEDGSPAYAREIGYGTPSDGYKVKASKPGNLQYSPPKSAYKPNDENYSS